MVTKKLCRKCSRILPLAEFYPDKKGKYGYRSQCKECERQYAIQNHDQIAERKAAWTRANKDRLRENAKQKLVEPEGIENRNRWQRAYRQQNPEKNRARAAVCRALRRGTIVKKPCVFCGDPVTEAHHHDYSKPLDVLWVCFRCHREKLHNQSQVLDREYHSRGNW